MNIPKLKGKLAEKQISTAMLSETIGIDRSTLYRKLNMGGDNFTIGEVKYISKLLDLTSAEINSIFFDN